MCILFFCQNDVPHPTGYTLVLANNRDELWDRPTSDASFWGPGLNCISGLDMNRGKEGGTWLGMNKSGKIGVLLNMLGHVDHGKKGRGFMVSNYIGQNWDMDYYAKHIFREKNDYNGFNLLLFDLGKQKRCRPAHPVFVTSAEDYHNYLDIGTLATNTSVGISNSPIEYPFQKVVHGRQRFAHILSKYPTVHSKRQLVSNIMDLMADKTSLLPDPVFERAARRRGVNPAYTSCRSAINTYSPIEKYGSRSTTIILVDGQGTVDYIERTRDLTQTSSSERTATWTFTMMQAPTVTASL